MRLALVGVVSTLIVATAPTHARAQHPSAADTAGIPVEGISFMVYDSTGQPRSFADILQAMDHVDVVLVGESHDDAVGHGVEAQLLYRAAERYGVVGDEAVMKRPVVLSLEMFERDVQYILDEYLDGLITEDQFEASARPWPRYATDYRPMVEFAKAHGIPVVAANAPRRYVNRVSRLGPASLDALSATAKQYLPPLPYPPASKAYAAQFDSLMREMTRPQPTKADSTAKTAQADSATKTARADSTARTVQPDSTTKAEPMDSAAKAPQAGAPAEESPQAPAGEARAMHSSANALAAQDLWDAAMGNAVANALNEHPDALVIHCAGSFHVEKGTGIPERVLYYRPGTRILTVVLEPTEDVAKWQDDKDRGLGDFVVLTKRSQGGG
jgi:uncharacterized iron-regulated protein